MADSGSIFHYYKKLISLRKNNLSLIYGSFEDIDPGDSSVFAFTRSMGKEQWLIILNMASKRITYHTERSGTLILSNYHSVNDNNTSFLLQPYEARIYKINK